MNFCVYYLDWNNFSKIALVEFALENMQPTKNSIEIIINKLFNLKQLLYREQLDQTKFRL